MPSYNGIMNAFLQQLLQLDMLQQLLTVRYVCIMNALLQPVRYVCIMHYPNSYYS